MCAPLPGLVLGGDRCICDSDCEPGANCGRELPEGFPGGLCIKSCDKAMPDSCGAGRVCTGNATNAFCFQSCKTHDDCTIGRICSNGVCTAYCAADSECDSNHCDPYRRLCRDATPPKGAGVFEKCVRNDDCRSRLCSPTAGRCLVGCIPGRVDCPDGAVCVKFPTGDMGLCLPPCGDDGACGDAALTCKMDTASGGRKYCF